MNLKDISVPDIYTDSHDFRFFLDWFVTALEKIRYDHDHFFDIYDPLRCKKELLWMLSDTMGYKYDDRLPASFCRLVLTQFMNMISYKGSKTGITLAAEVNLAQFNLIEYGIEKEILFDRLEDTSIPVNCVYVTAHTAAGYIDVVYFSTEKPIDACIEYVRPLGMYLFQHAGVRFDADTEIAVDARLTNINESTESIGPNRVAHYSREDYARLQKMIDEPNQNPDDTHTRKNAWYANSDYEDSADINPGLRSIYSLQLSNNEHMYRSLLKPIFDLGYEPQDDSEESQNNVRTSDKFLDNEDNSKWWNLRYDRERDEFIDTRIQVNDTLKGATTSRPKVAPTMAVLGDAIAIPKNKHNDRYVIKKSDADGGEVKNYNEIE